MEVTEDALPSEVEAEAGWEAEANPEAEDEAAAMSMGMEGEAESITDPAVSLPTSKSLTSKNNFFFPLSSCIMFFLRT